MLVPPARIRHPAGESRAGKREAHTAGREQGAPFWRKRPQAEEPPRVGRAPAGRMGGAPTKSLRRGTGAATRVGRRWLWFGQIKP